MSEVPRPMSEVPRLMSEVASLMSEVPRPMSEVPRLMSEVPRPMSEAPRPMSEVVLSQRGGVLEKVARKHTNAPCETRAEVRFCHPRVHGKVQIKPVPVLPRHLAP